MKDSSPTKQEKRQESPASNSMEDNVYRWDSSLVSLFKPSPSHPSEGNDLFALSEAEKRILQEE